MANTAGTNATANMLSGPTTKATHFLVSTKLQCAQVRSIFFSKILIMGFRVLFFSFLLLFSISILRRLFRAPRKNRTIFVKRVCLYYSQVWSSNHVCWWLLCITRIKAQNATLLAPRALYKQTNRADMHKDEQGGALVDHWRLHEYSWDCRYWIHRMLRRCCQRRVRMLLLSKPPGYYNRHGRV